MRTPDYTSQFKRDYKREKKGLAGDVIPGADGARKVRWNRTGLGKSGGTRVIYFNLTEREALLLIAVYAKSDRDNMHAADIKKAF